MDTPERIELARINTLLKEKLLRWLPKPGKISTAIDPLGFSRREAPNQPENCFYKPSVGVILQGYKRSVVGSQEYSYGENECLVAGVDMPSSFYVTEASPEKPFLAISLDLDKLLIAKLASEISLPPTSGKTFHKGVSVKVIEPDVLEAFLRLADLLDKPKQIPVLAPMIIREIHYKLLIGPQGEDLRKINTLGTQGNQIAQAITWMRHNYKEPLLIDEIARKVNMARSTFHRHFKEMTTISPLQFHKRLRLYEAQRLMLTEKETAASAALAVGYDSPTQFNREYKRLFGEPPYRDIQQML